VRDLTSAVKSAIDTKSVEPFILFEGEFISGHVRLWSGYGDLVWDSKTWTGTGTLGSVAPLQESADIQANGVAVSLSGIPSSVISTALSDVQQGAPGTLYLGLLSNGSVIADPFELFSGRIDVPSINEDSDTSTIQLTYESKLIDLQKPREFRYTDEDQQRMYPGDLGFEFVPDLQDKIVNWGKK
jgi:hypothetical protein